MNVHLKNGAPTPTSTSDTVPEDEPDFYMPTDALRDFFQQIDSSLRDEPTTWKEVKSRIVAYTKGKDQ